MDKQILGSAEMAADAAQLAAGVAVLFVLLRLRRDIAALLRVVRRMDRKTAHPAITPYRGQAERDEAPVRFAGSRRPELERVVAD